jgi:hypothetical protein
LFTSLKRAITKSLGEVVRKIVCDKSHFFQLLSIMDIIQPVRAFYGIMHKNIKTTLLNKMTTMLKTVDDLESHVANLEALFETYDGASAVPLDEDRKIEYYRGSVFGHPMIITILLNFDLAFPDGNAHTFTQITEYVKGHLPNIKNSQQSSTRLQANMVNTISSEAYAALKTENEFLKRKQSGHGEEK